MSLPSHVEVAISALCFESMTSRKKALAFSHMKLKSADQQVPATTIGRIDKSRKATH